MRKYIVIAALLVFADTISAQNWLLLGNGTTAPTDSAIHFVGTNNLRPIMFRTNNVARMKIVSNGNVLIGTTTDAAGILLNVNGAARFNTNIQAYTFSGASAFDVGSVRISDNASQRYIEAVNGLQIRQSGSTTNYFHTLGTSSVISHASQIDFLAGGNSTSNPSLKLTSVTTSPSNTTLSFFNLRNDGSKSAIINTADFNAGAASPAVDLFIHAGSNTFNNTQGNLILAHNGTTKRGNVLIGGITNDVSAILNLQSVTQGFLTPRMTTAQRTAISTPANGLLTYQTDGTAGFYVNQSGTWRRLLTDADATGGATVYTANGTLTSNRTLDLGTSTLSFGKGANTNFHLFNNGNVWMGNGAPVDNANKLQVNGSIWNNSYYQQNYFTDVANTNFRMGSGYQLFGTTHASGGYTFYLSGGLSGDWNSAWNLVIGNNTNKILDISNDKIIANQPLSLNSNLSVKGLNFFQTTPYHGIIYDDNAGWKYSVRGTSGTDRLVVHQTGNIGINTTTDDGINKLQVNGRVKIAGLTNDNTQNNIVVSDASGNLFLRDATTITGAGNNIYTSDGALTSNRFLNLGTTSTLSFGKGSPTNTNFHLFNNGRVWIGNGTPVDQVEGAFGLQVANNIYNATGYFQTGPTKIRIVEKFEGGIARGIEIGRGNTNINTLTTEGHIIIGGINNIPDKAGTMIIGHQNNVIAVNTSPKIFGNANTVSGDVNAGAFPVIIGDYNTVNGGSGANAANYVLGSWNNTNNFNGILIGDRMTLTTHNQLSFGFNVGNVDFGIREVYFGNGVRNELNAPNNNSGHGVNVSLNASGGFNGANFNGGNITIAGGKGTGAGTGGDVIFSTTNALTSGSTLQSLSERIRIKYNTGNVLIGTSSDNGYKLDVNGTINTTSFKMNTGAGAGKVLTSDANGVASWQPAAGGTGSTIYTANGTLTDNRFVNLGTTSTLSFGKDANTNFHLFNNGNIWMGNGTPSDGGQQVQINGNTKVSGQLLAVGTPGLIGGVTQSDFVPSFGGGVPATFQVNQQSGNWGLAITRSDNNLAGPHMTFFKTYGGNTASVKGSIPNGTSLGNLNFMGVAADNSTVFNGATVSVYGYATGNVSYFSNWAAGSVPPTNTIPTSLQFTVTDFDGVKRRVLDILPRGQVVITKTGFLDWSTDYSLQVDGNASLHGVVAVGNNPGTKANQSAQLEIVSTNKGVLIPRMTTAQRDLISSPANSLLIFNLTANRFEYYDALISSWTSLNNNSASAENGVIINTANNNKIELGGSLTKNTNIETNNFNLTFNGLGNVGIGINNPAEKLSVNGNIVTKKIRVTQTGWADYVFAPGYKLPTLADVEAFIKTNQHLPDVPSAAEVEKKGLDLGDNQAILLKKIEELTLYMIQQNKQIEELTKEVNKLKKGKNK
jgi:hypothetical protein